MTESRTETATGTPADLAFQDAILPRVSRTFALTIPQLPARLHGSVANAYLLCRLADTIEDDPALDGNETSEFMEEFLALVDGDGQGADDFARRLGSRLSGASSPAERELVAGTAAVLRITHRLPTAHREAVIRCVTTMGRGMPAFQQRKTIEGLTTLEDLDQYCYFVAGVVGEMLTDLFCDHCPELRSQRNEMMALAVCFGQGLQMTNILKDIWEDRGSDTCWLPRSVFGNLDQGLGHALRERDGTAMQAGITRLVAIAHGHLHSALRYTQRIPRRESGIRRFCLWAIGMALLTLRKIHANPGYTSGRDVKISRNAVRATILVSNLVLRSDRAMDAAFSLAARGLPQAPDEALCPPPGARLVSDRLS